MNGAGAVEPKGAHGTRGNDKAHPSFLREALRVPVFIFNASAGVMLDAHFRVQDSACTIEQLFVQLKKFVATRIPNVVPYWPRLYGNGRRVEPSSRPFYYYSDRELWTFSFSTAPPSFVFVKPPSFRPARHLPVRDFRMSVGELMELIEQQEGTPVCNQRLTFGDRTLKATRSLQHYGIREGVTLFLSPILKGLSHSLEAFDSDASDERLHAALANGKTNGASTPSSTSSSKAEWRVTRPGLCVEGRCSNENCKTRGSMVVCKIGLCEFSFDSTADRERLLCPRCQQSVEPEHCTFNRCIFQFVGLHQSPNGSAVLRMSKPQEAGAALVRFKVSALSEKSVDASPPASVSAANTPQPSPQGSAAAGTLTTLKAVVDSVADDEKHPLSAPLPSNSASKDSLANLSPVNASTPKSGFLKLVAAASRNDIAGSMIAMDAKCTLCLERLTAATAESAPCQHWYHKNCLQSLLSHRSHCALCPASLRTAGAKSSPQVQATAMPEAVTRQDQRVQFKPQVQALPQRNHDQRPQSQSLLQLQPAMPQHPSLLSSAGAASSSKTVLNGRVHGLRVSQSNIAMKSQSTPFLD